MKNIADEEEEEEVKMVVLLGPTGREGPGLGDFCCRG